MGYGSSLQIVHSGLNDGHDDCESTRLANASDGDRRAMTAAARRAFADRWERQVDPDGVLTPEERSRRAEHAKSAHFQRMALKSAQMRRRRRAV